MGLRYPPFAASVDLEHAAHHGPSLRIGAHGTGVAVLQGGLIQLGYKLPNSTRKFGAPDGLLGYETKTTIAAFQGAYGLDPDGVAGPKTVVALDAALVAITAPLPHAPPAPPPPLTNPDYALGSGDPPLHHDAGAGVWNSKPKEVAYMALKLEIEDHLTEASLVIGNDAAKHMGHYLGNSGSDYTIDLEGMVKDVPSAKERYTDEVAQAQGFVEQLAPGRYTIASKQAEGGYNTKDESWNWFYAIGGYSSWGKGAAVVTETPAGRQYELDFEYKFYDRYNWDKGKSVRIFKIKITDEFMGEFHRQGLAQEFDCYGSFKRKFTWKKGEAIKPSQLYPAGQR